MGSHRTPAEVMRGYLTEVALGGRLELLDELAYPDMVDEANQIFGGPPGVAGLRAHVVGFRRYITNLDIEIGDLVGGDDRAMARWSFRGRHTGPWLGLDPTGSPVTGTVVSTFDLADGRIIRYRLWLHADFGSRQLTFDSSSGRPPA